MKVKVGPYSFPIRFHDSEDPTNSDLFGSFHMVGGIEVAPELDPPTMASTIVHEMIHAVYSVYKLPKSRMTEEQAAQRLEGPLLALIHANPGLLRALADAVDGVPLKGIQRVKE